VRETSVGANPQSSCDFATSYANSIPPNTSEEGAGRRGTVEH